MISFIDIIYVCVNVNHKIQFDYNTISLTKKGSIEKLLVFSTMDWKEAKKYGWRCVKAEIDITPKTELKNL